MESQVYNMDCLLGMKKYPDQYFELAIVDPPYGININMNMGRRKNKRKNYNDKNWDNEVPNDLYFDELFRVSKNQIIWGGNYFDLGPSKHFIFWDKLIPEGMSFSDGELAWTSFDRAIKKFTFLNKQNNRIHPTQKPVALYRWLLKNYAKPNDKILDTHLGSGSSRIAADMEGFHFTGFELDKDYFDSSIKRYNEYKQQIILAL